MASLKQYACIQIAQLCRAGMRAGCAAILLLGTVPVAQAVSWDSQESTTGGNPAGSGSQWWFDHFNWGGTGNTPGTSDPGFLPPANNNSGGGPSGAEINSGTATLPGGEGVVYYPFYDSNTMVGDPNFPNAGSLPYPSTYGAQILSDLYISRNTTNHNLLTIKGDLTIKGNMIVGRSGSSVQNQNLGTVVQLAGSVLFPDATNLDVGQRESAVGWGNGIYDYRGGILRVGINFTGVGIRLSHGSTSNGTGGHGRFIMHNPTSEGFVRTYNFATASDGNNGDGVLTGVGINEFHFENGGTRPIQVENNLSINNGPVAISSAIIRSARLELVLHEAPMVDGNGVPQNLGLFDTRFGQVSSSGISGTGDLDGDGSTVNDRVFSSADGTRHFYPSSRWADVKTSPTFGGLNLQDEDFLLTAAFGGKLYRWEACYSCNISWVGNGDTGVVSSIGGTGTGGDVVLIGHSSISIGLPGDYNIDNKVDAADYVIWRANEVANAALPNDNGVGNQAARYALWRSGFGNPGSASGLSADAVPEPVTLALVLTGLIGASLARHRS